ncbi:MAG: hypothetical protein IJ334_18860, partial [Clostridia bacterium]|nr:hypothetical protein [Clostridia bacterium]
REITPPEHYISSGTIYPLDFSKGEDIRLEIQNTRAPVTLEVSKQNENGQPLAGAEFKLTEDPEGLYVKGTGTTGPDGQLTFYNLIPNRSYSLWETKAPEGYQRLTDPVQFQTDLQNGGSLVRLTVSNQLVPITLTVEKVDDESRAPLPGASFRLTTDPEGLVEHAAVSCDANGVAVFYDLLPDRTYYLWETTAPAGYVCPTTCVREIHTTKQQSSIREIIENSKIRTKLIVTKIDADTSLPLSGAELVLSRDEAGTDVIRSLETDASGIALFEDLLPGHTYYVTERRAPARYEKTDKVFPVTIPAGSSEPVSLTIPNRRISGGSGSGGSGGDPTPQYYTLTYDCLLSDAELYDDLAYLTGRGDCSMHLQTMKNSYTNIGTGSSGEESPDDILKRLSEAGGLIWREYAAGKNWAERVEETRFEMQKITVEPDFFLNTGKLNGAETVHWGFYCRFFPWLRGILG